MPMNPFWLNLAEELEKELAALQQLKQDGSAWSSEGDERVENTSRRASFRRAATNLFHGSGQRRPNVKLADFIGSPSSRKRFVWDVIGLVCLMWDLITVPLQVFDATDGPFFNAVGVMVGSFWTLDILASFLVGYHAKGFVEMRPAKIALRYLRSWFVFDLGLVSVEWVFLVLGRDTPGTSQASMMRLGKISRGFRVLRLLRIMKVQMMLSDMTTRIKSEFKRTILGVLRIISFIVFMNHFLACGWYGLHWITPAPTWVELFFPEGDTFGYRYWTSMHWSLTQFTPASMEVTAKNEFERFYTVVVLLFALVTFSSFVSSITNAMSYLMRVNARNMEEQLVLRRYLSQHKISAALVSRIMHLFSEGRQKKSHIKRTKEEDVELFKLLPEKVRHELRIEVFTPVISAHPLFFRYNTVDPDAVMQLCTSCVKEQTVLVGEELFGDGNAIKQMVFVHDGSLSYEHPQTRSAKRTTRFSARTLAPARSSISSAMSQKEMSMNLVESGQWACEVALWVVHAEIFCPFTAVVSSELVMLSASGFLTVAKRFPDTACLLARYAKLYIEWANEECSLCRWRGVLCNELDTVQDYVHSVFDGGAAAVDL